MADLFTAPVSATESCSCGAMVLVTATSDEALNVNLINFRSGHKHRVAEQTAPKDFERASEREKREVDIAPTNAEREPEPEYEPVDGGGIPLSRRMGFSA